jgi:small subunit ribosomal protein S8
MVNDPIADYINRLKNASVVRSNLTSVPYSKTKEAIANLLKKEGYINFVNIKGKSVKRSLEVGLVYNKDGSPKINETKRISKPSRRIYKSSKEIRPVKFGKGTLILSTPKGIITGKEAKKAKVGGEVLFEIY